MELKATILIDPKVKSHLIDFKGWNVNKLAEKMGINKQQVSQSLNGRVQPSMRFIRKFVEVTKLDIKDILIIKWKA